MSIIPDSLKTILLIGLGNPGEKFQKTRHNLGFRVVDEFVRENNFPDFGFAKKFNSLISEGFLDKQKIIIAKPQTFMNNSGIAVKRLVKNLKLEIRNLIVVHDDLDLPLGKMRISIGRSSAGHKGVQSIIDELKTKNFVRFRVGIQPTTYNLQLTTAEKFVLQKFTKEEEKILKEVIKKTAQAIKTAAAEGIEKAMSEYNCNC